jgi:hypothetical protein
VLYGSAQEVTALESNRELTDEERRATSLLTVTAAASFDWDALSSWDVGELVSWGLDADLLAQWNDDAANLALMFEAEKEPHSTDDPAVDYDRAETLRDEWGVSVGQTWVFEIPDAGESTLFVGPAESAHLVCDLAIYDPPFEWTARQQENALSWTSWRKALLMGLVPCMPLSERADFLHWWVWDSGMARFGGRGYKPMSGCALMLAFGEKQGWYETPALAVLDAYGVEHFEWPTQVVHIQDHLANRQGYEKPAALWDYAIALYSTAGDVVGDPFAGSGSVAAACKRLKRRYRGAEIEPTCVALSLQRLRDMGLEPHLAETPPDRP